jgi:EmrB/QacA subfamily drug resistance transporter
VTTATAEAGGLRYASTAGRWVLAATILGSGVAAIDATVVGIALPTIGRDFRTGLAPLQWIVNGYTLTLAGLLLVAGALGDRYGRRLVFVIGVVWFALASLLCALAPNAPTLIGARVVQGIGAALLTPGSLAVIEASFVPADRGRAIGAWSGLGGVATAVGPFLGGWLIQAASWRLIFLINVPIAAVVVLLALRHVPESRDPAAPRRIDLVGGALATAGLVGLVYGLIDGPARGWPAPALAVLAGGLALLIGFGWWESRTPTPMLPLRLFAVRQFSATNAVTFVVYGALGGCLFLLPIQLQRVDRYTPVQAGLALLPVTLVMLAFSGWSGTLAGRIGPRLQMSVGPVVVGAGLALLALTGRAGGSYLTEALPGVLVFGLGLAITVAPLTATALSAAPPEQAGIASAVNNDLARAGGLIAVAVLPAAAGISGAAYLDPARFATGFRTAAFLGGALCVLGGVLAVLAIRNPPPPAPAAPRPRSTSHCGLEAPPLRYTAAPGTRGGPAASPAFE